MGYDRALVGSVLYRLRHIDLRNRVSFVTVDEFDDVSAEYDQAHREMAVRSLRWYVSCLGDAPAWREKQTWQSLRSRAETALTS
jgi:hypothetical protein